MARSNKLPKGSFSLLDFEAVPGQVYERLEYMRSPKGMFATMQPHQADRDTAIVAKNFIINENGKLQIRKPYNQIYYNAGVVPIGIVGVSDSTGSGTLLLFHQAGVKWSTDGGTNWSDATGAALTGAGAFLLINWAMWDSNTLLFTTNDATTTKIWAFNISAKTYATIAASPASQVMTVFGGRVITSNGTSSTLNWSIKNGHTDWTGIGSGTETLRLSPGNTVDDVIGMFPLNDTQMLICRTGSVWMATITGNVDVPFEFSFLYKINLTAARTLSYSPEGIYALGLDNIYLLNVAGPKAIGNPVIGRWVSSDVVVYNQYQAVGVFDPLKQSYYLFIPYTSSSNIALYLRGTDSGSSTNSRVTDSGEDRIADYPLTDPTLVLVYNARWDKWTYLSVPLNLQYMTAINFRTPAIKGLAFTTTNNQAFTDYRADQTVPNDGNDEKDYTNNWVSLEAELVTGVIGPQDNSRVTRIRKVEIDLTTSGTPATSRRTLIQLYKTRSGPASIPANAVTYSDKTTTDSEGRILHPAIVDQAIATFTQMGIKISKCSSYVLEGVYVYASMGAEINQ